MTLERTVNGPSYGLGGARTRVFFDTDPLVISQMSHDGLAFFPEPGDCDFTIGEHNEDIGLIAVRVVCPELVDIRDNGTISLEGYVALPADLVVEVDRADTGGTVMVGDEEWELSEEAVLLIGPELEGHEDGSGSDLFVQSDDLDTTLILRFGYDGASERVALGTVFYRGGVAEIDPGECSTETEELAAINPQASVMEATFSCESVDVSSVGAVSIEGHVVFERVYYFDPGDEADH